MPGAHSLKSISVDLEILTTDRLRKVVFGLDKSTDDTDTVTWAIRFLLYERETKTADFGDPLVKLSVIVKKQNFGNAQLTAMKGLNASQAEHLLGPAAVDAKRFKAGKITEDKANATAERTLPKRDA